MNLALLNNFFCAGPLQNCESYFVQFTDIVQIIFAAISKADNQGAAAALLSNVQHCTVLHSPPLQ